MPTGDNKTTASAVSRKLGIKEIEADVHPQDTRILVHHNCNALRIYYGTSNALRMVFGASA